MIWIDHLSLFSTLDFIALACLISTWLLISWWIENPPKSRVSVSNLMSEYRREWMRQFVGREPRVYDAQVMTNLRQGAAFFASASMIAIGGGLALIGDVDQLQSVANVLTPASTSEIVWEIKLLVMVLFVTNAFLKFVWAHRLFGYGSVVMSAVPNDPGDPNAMARADKAAEINITAARSFNRGMRSVYFSLASAAWLIGASALIGAAIFTFLVLWRREFASHSRKALCERTDGMGQAEP
jgi:uncharacterized membrane protein